MLVLLIMDVFVVNIYRISIFLTCSIFITYLGIELKDFISIEFLLGYGIKDERWELSSRICHLVHKTEQG